MDVAYNTMFYDCKAYFYAPELRCLWSLTPNRNMTNTTSSHIQCIASVMAYTGMHCGTRYYREIVADIYRRLRYIDELTWRVAVDIPPSPPAYDLKQTHVENRFLALNVPLLSTELLLSKRFWADRTAASSTEAVPVFLSVWQCPSATLCIVELTVGVGVKSSTVMFLAGHFLFTSSDAFAVGCIV